MESAPLARSQLVQHLPIIVYVLEQLGIVDVLRRRLPKHDLSHVSDADCVAVLILNILSGRSALYNIEHFLKGVDLPLLIGDHAKPEHFNDTRLGLALDHLDEGGADSLFTEIVTLYLRREDAPRDFTVHLDATSIALYGVYDGQQHPAPTYGFSKDKRPDLKQLVFGMAVRGGDAMPLIYDLADGNTHDSNVDRELIGGLQWRLRQDCDVTLVADSKAADARTIGLILEEGFHFVTLLPDTYSLRANLIAAAFEAEPGLSDWPVLAEKPGRRKADPKRYYRGWSVSSPFTVHRGFEGEVVESQKCRCLVVASDTLAERFEKSLPGKLKAEREKLKKGLVQLNRKGFACAADAQSAGEKLLKKVRFHDVEVGTYFDEVAEKRGRGRPSKGSKAKTKRVFKARVRVSESASSIEEARRRGSCFLLLSDHLDEDAWPDTRLLATYRHQNLVENHTGFRWLKSQAGVSPMFLKTSRRIRALGLVFVLSLMVRNYLQHQLRSQLSERGETIPHPFTKQEESKLTTEMMFQHFAHVHSVLLSQGDEPEQRMAISLPPVAQRILRLLDVPSSRFRDPPRSPNAIKMRSPPS